MGALLEVASLTVRYGGLKAVDDVSFVVERGRFVGLIGPNGAGKTTFMDAVTGLTPSSGSILFDGKDVNRLPAHRRARTGIARTFQSLELFEDLTVRENLLVSAERASWWSPLQDLVRPRPTAGAAAAVDRSFDLLGLGPIADVLPPALSLGQRKLVTIARSLALEPQLLLLDEPAAGLDSNEGLALGERLRQVVADGITILMIDHDMGLVLGVCDHIEVLDFGVRIAGGTPDEIRRNERVIHAYLGTGDDDAADQQGAAAAPVVDMPATDESADAVPHQVRNR